MTKSWRGSTRWSSRWADLRRASSPRPSTPSSSATARSQPASSRAMLRSIRSREIFVALKIASDLERICDYAANVAKRSIALSQSPPVQLVHALPRMAQFALLLAKDVIDAYVEHDSDKALAVWKRDEELDEMYSSLFREFLTYMMEDPRNIGTCTHLLFMAKTIARIGDQATNIAETLYSLVHGTPLTQARPKGDKSSLEVVAPDRAQSR